MGNFLIKKNRLSLYQSIIMSTRNNGLKRKKTSEAELHNTVNEHGDNELPYYATNCPQLELPTNIPQVGFPAKFVNRWIKDQHSLDFSQLLNTSSYVNVVFEKEEEDIAKLGMRINLADQTVYTQSFDLHNRTLAMVANLWNCPKPSNFEE